MKITHIETIPFRIPLKKATQWARGRQEAAEHVLVKVYTDEGVIGIAEAPPRPTIYGESVASIRYAIDAWFGPMVKGLGPFETEKIWDAFDSIAGNTTAKASIDIAIHDIQGKILNMPCYEMLGSWTDKIRMAWCVNLNPLKEMVEEAKMMIQHYGFKTIKLKVGIDPDKDVEMVRVMRKELGGDILLYVDANQGYEPFAAVHALERMLDYGIILAEEPCSARDRKGRKMIANRLDIPLSGDESCVTADDVAGEIELDALRVVNIKTARTGFTQSKKIVHICETARIRNVLGFQGDTGLGSIASAHFCAAHKNTGHYYASEASFFLWLVDDFLKEPVTVEKGHLLLPKGPGLGIEIDDKKLKKFALA